MSRDHKAADSQLIVCLLIALLIMPLHFSIGVGLATGFLLIRVGRAL